MSNDNVTDQFYYPCHTNPHLGSKKNRTLIITNPVIQNIPVILSNRQPPENNHVQRNLNNIIQVNITAVSPNRPSGIRVKKFVLPKMLLLNARSLLPKLDELRALLSVNTVDMVVVTETWFSDAFDDCSVSINGYNLLRRDRRNGRGGGVCTFVSEILRANRRTDLENDNFECL